MKDARNKCYHFSYCVINIAVHSKRESIRNLSFCVDGESTGASVNLFIHKFVNDRRDRALFCVQSSLTSIRFIPAHVLHLPLRKCGRCLALI